MEVRNLLIRNVIPILDPDNMEQSADSFLADYGGYMKQIAAIAKHDSGFALYESNVAPIHEEHGDFFSTIAKITDAAGIKLYAAIYTFVDSYYGVDPARTRPTTLTALQTKISSVQLVKPFGPISRASLKRLSSSQYLELSS